MNGKTRKFLELTALPGIGEFLLDGRAALVFAADGSVVLWANAAAVAFFGERDMADLLDRRFSTLNPLKQQISRLSRQLPAETARLEMLRVGGDTRFTSVPASCRRINLAGGGRAVLVVVARQGERASTRARAEILTELIAGDDCLVAILSEDGRVLSASGRHEDLAPVARKIDDLVEEAAYGRRPLIKRDIAVDGLRRPAGVARLEGYGDALFLVMVGPGEPVETMIAAEESPPPVEADGEIDDSAEQAGATDVGAEMPPTDDADGNDDAASNATDPVTARPRLERFVWESDADGQVLRQTGDLAAAVGDENAGLVGRRWIDVASMLGFASPVPASDAGPTSFTVRWPDAGTGETVAVDLTVLPAADDSGGWRGFGLARCDDRQPDRRSSRQTVTDLDAARPAEHGGEPEIAATGEPAAAPEANDDESATADEPEQRAPGSAEATESEVGQPTEPRREHAPAQPQQANDTTSTADLDDSARRFIETGRLDARHEAPEVETDDSAVDTDQTEDADEDVPDDDNVVHLPVAERPNSTEPLAGHERDAFRRIGETLNSTDADPGHDTATAGDDASVDDTDIEPVVEDRPRSPVTKAILDRVPVGLIVLRDRETLFANRAVCELLGYDSAEELADAGGIGAVFPDQPDRWTGPNLTGNGSRLFAARRDGGTVAVSVRLNSVEWQDGAALMASLSADAGGDDPDDEMARELASAAARIGELEAVLDTATDGVVVIDRQGRIGNLNQSAEALFGVEANDMIGRPLTDLLAEESQRPALDYLDGLASNGVASVLNDGREVIGKVPRGGLIPLFMTMGRVGDGETFCAVLRDITHWKNVEEELTAAKREAEAANAQKSDFLAKVSHEIRTPLNAIIGFSEVMMEERFGPVGNNRYRSYLHDIHTSGGHLMSLINDLLDLSKIEAGKLELSFESVPLNDVIQECVALMQPQANRERIIIRTSLAEDVPNVVADQRSLKQILLNLLSNAIKFTGSGGQVIVSTGLEENGEVVLRVRDTGIGMSDKDVEAAMQPFRQVATSKRGKEQGTGLGLPLTKALVEANRASFAIDSAPDQGTLVRITFPTTRVLAG